MDGWHHWRNMNRKAEWRMPHPASFSAWARWVADHLAAVRQAAVSRLQLPRATGRRQIRGGAFLT